ncbi:hypothetical protein [Catellatospora vulcania]|uniref:hypothetical protein n=1 Tax=Catellatospora vulcania TaxID=1460450 RepID=UPI0012D3C853|nr:hypothetical protein [Catellatospora vulcania]
MDTKRDTLSPTELIAVGIIILIFGVIGSVAHIRGHGVSRTRFGPFAMITIGAAALIAGISWALLT